MRYRLITLANSSIINSTMTKTVQDHMLTNVELVVMRFVKIKPSYAYEIENIITKWQLRHWVKIGEATIYQVLDRLCKRGLLEYKIEKEGNMPQRRRYFITSQGEEVFLDSVRQIFTTVEPYYFDLSIGLACRTFLEEEDFKGLIQVRLDKLNAFIDDFNEVFEKSKVLYPTRRVALREYLLSHYELERSLLRKLLDLEDTGNVPAKHG